MRDTDGGTRDRPPGSADIAGAVLFGVVSIALIALAPPAPETVLRVQPAVTPRFEPQQPKAADKIAWHLRWEHRCRDTVAARSPLDDVERCSPPEQKAPADAATACCCLVACP
jgi:hypothetical protein